MADVVNVTLERATHGVEWRSPVGVTGEGDGVVAETRINVGCRLGAMALWVEQRFGLLDFRAGFQRVLLRGPQSLQRLLGAEAGPESIRISRIEASTRVSAARACLSLAISSA